MGAYPEPFVNGIEGKRRPVRVECEDAESDACETVKERLRERGVPATGSSLGASGTENVIRVVVGNWAAVRLVQALAEIEDGPRESGVFARFVRDGDALELLGDDGQPVEEQQCCSGLVAAVAPSEEEIVWAVTGLDDMGVLAAARLLDGVHAARRLRGGDHAARHRDGCRWSAREDARAGLPPARQRAPRARAPGWPRSTARSLALVVALYEHPLVLAAVIAAVVAAGVACGVGSEIARAAWLSLPLALLIAAGQPARLPGGRHAAGARRRVPRPALGRDPRGAWPPAA